MRFIYLTSGHIPSYRARRLVRLYRSYRMQFAFTYYHR